MKTHTTGQCDRVGQPQCRDNVSDEEGRGRVEIDPPGPVSVFVAVGGRGAVGGRLGRGRGKGSPSQRAWDEHTGRSLVLSPTFSTLFRSPYQISPHLLSRLSSPIYLWPFTPLTSPHARIALSTLTPSKVDKVDATMDSIREQMDLTNEISDAISNPVGMNTILDEDDLQAELDALEQEELDSRLAGADHVPVHTPASPVAASKGKVAAVKDEDDEEAQLRQLQAELAM